MNKKLSEFRKLFFEELDKKTGWGKEEVKKKFDETYIKWIDYEVKMENLK